MRIAARDGCGLRVTVSGPEDGPALVLIHALGTSRAVWDDLLPLLPEGLRLVSFDLRGHGASDVSGGPYAMGTLVSDAEAVIDGLGLRDVVVLGLSIGGMVAQGLAVKRLDLVRAVILSNTAAKIGQPAQWAERIAAVEAGGMAAIAEATLARWFPRRDPAAPEVDRARALLLATPPAGYAGGCAAIAGSDFWTPTSGLRLPALGIAGADDGSTPPDLVRETVALIPGSKTVLIPRAGHLPCLDAPGPYAEAISGFLAGIGHV